MYHRIIFTALLACTILALGTMETSAERRRDRSVEDLKEFREMLVSNEFHLNERIKKVDDWTPTNSQQVRGLARIYTEFQEVAAKRSDYTRINSAILRRIGLLEKEDVCLPLIADLTDDKLEWPLRQAYFNAVMNIENQETSDLLLVLADDESASIRVLAVTELGTRLADEGFKKVTERIQDSSWRVRAACLDSLCEFAKKRNGFRQPVLKGIIEDFNFQKRNQGSLLERSCKVLEELTEESYGTDVVAWFQWYARSNGGKEDTEKKVVGKAGTNTVWGAKTSSKAMVFIIDNSDSMKELIDPAIIKDRAPTTGGDREEKDPDVDWDQVKTKLDLARAELILTIKSLSGGPDDKKSRKKKSKDAVIEDPDYFTIISYSTHVKAWMEEIVPATEDNKKSAIEFLKALKTDRLTNIFGSLNRAFEIAEKAYADKEAAGKSKRNKRRSSGGRSKTREGEANDEVLVPDTFFFLTDGFATAGEFRGPDIEGAATPEQNKEYYKAMDDMLEALKERNRVARVTIHAFGVGREHDHKTLEKLAEDHRGTYVRLDAKKSMERDTDPEKAKKDAEKKKEEEKK